MSINYNINPYYDDFDQTKQYYRVLFRPGRAVQARELTQIQTSIQKQIENFGQSIYKDGSVVVPGSISLDTKLPYANLTPSYGANTSDTVISSLLGETIIGETSGVKGIVVNYQNSTTVDPPTIYIRYTSANTFAEGSYTTFQPNETIRTESGNLTLKIESTNPIGYGTEFSIGSGVLFTKGVFAYFDFQKIIAEKYTQSNNAIFGFEISESTVDSQEDTSLLDPAIGASNYIAPGADRYKISLDLARRPLTFDSTKDPNFIEMLRLEQGRIISKNLKPEYSVLGQTLARRTYDESGDYSVDSYRLTVLNDLAVSNANNSGYRTASDGGSDDNIVCVVSEGKSYIKGYEVETLAPRYIIAKKSRDFANVNNSVISSPIGNYILVKGVKSIPSLSTLPSVVFYDRYNITPGTPNGNPIGTARIRGMQFYSGTPGSIEALYKVWLFDVKMYTGYVFESDVKQIYVDNTGYLDFTANISPTLTVLTGSVTVTNTINTITGVATSFDKQLSNVDFITVGTQTLEIKNVVNAISATANSNSVANLTGVFAYLNTVTVNQTKDLSYLFELPYPTIRSVDPTNLETIYDVIRPYSRTLTSNTVTIAAGVDETFGTISTSDFILVVKSGTYAGQYLNPNSYVTRTVGGTSITIDLSSLAGTPANVTAYSTADIEVIAKLTKTNSASSKKLKTLVTNATTTYNDANTAQASTVSVGKADAYRLVSVLMSNVAFGSAYTDVGAVDITDRYTFDNGQKLTYYDVGKITLKPNVQKPTGPIKITFDYFTHGTGDYFSVNSYSIDYKDIPTYVNNGKSYVLRNCLDFRPRINDAGTGFSGTGSVVNDFVYPNGDIITDYSYYLGRIDKISLNKDGRFTYTEGISSLDPKEPNTPADNMALFVLSQKPYVFDVTQDIEYETIDNRRYTMRDIGKIENRVKNLEYYTSLNLLEQNTQALQVKDSQGLDRFKNGFIVDKFDGHGVGDVKNPDYGVSIDYNLNILRPIIKTISVSLTEINTSDAARTSNNYVRTTDIVTLPYSHVEYVKNSLSSKTENINPFSVITWLGRVKLNPPSDVWIDMFKQPTITKNVEGNYNQFLADAKAKGTYGTVWGQWTTTYSGDYRISTRSGTEYTVTEKIDTTTNKDVVVSSVVVPKMRDATIRFIGEGLKPNTRMRVFFDNLNVTGYCSLSNTAPITNADSLITYAINDNKSNNIITDSTGKVDGVFFYRANTLNLNTGEKSFRLTDSPTNSSDFETLADGTFSASGKLNYVRDEIISTRNGQLTTKAVFEQKQEYIQPPAPPDPPGPADTFDYVDFVYAVGFGRVAEPEGKKYWYNVAQQDGITTSVISGAMMTTNYNNLINPSTGSIGGKAASDVLNNPSLIGYNSAAVKLFNFTQKMCNGGVSQENRWAVNFSSSLLGAHLKLGVPDNVAALYTAAQITIAQMGYNSGFVPASAGYYSYTAEASYTPISTNPTAYVVSGSTICRGGASDPLAQTFFVDTPLFLSKVDLFFSSKDNKIPMKIELRKVVNGSPGSVIIPLSEKYVYPSSINISDNGSVATTIAFDSPVYLDIGEYALVLMADSIDYRVYISQMNEKDILTGQLISKQPYVGVLFKSQNASTWSPDQYQDLKFTLYRADFNTTSTGVVEFKTDSREYQNQILPNNPIEVSPRSNIVRIYHPAHGQNTGSSIRISGWPITDNVANANTSTFFGLNIASQLEYVPFVIDNVTQDTYTIALPQPVNSNVTSILRCGTGGVVSQKDFKYDTYYPYVSTLELSGTKIQHKIKTTKASTYTLDADYTSIPVGNYEFLESRVLTSNINGQIYLSNANPFIHRIEFSSSTSYLSPVIDTTKVAGIFVRNLINNPSYDSENKILANDIITIANASGIVFSQVSGARGGRGRGLITLAGTQDKINATSIIKGTYLNVTANNVINNGRYRVIDVTDNGANISVYNISSQNVSTNALSFFTITNGRNFVSEEAAVNGSAYSKYITKEVTFANPCTLFKFYLDAMKPIGSNLKFYYKVSEVGDTTDLSLKEYTEVTDVTVPISYDGNYNDVEKLVEGLPQFDSIIFKIVFLGSDTSKPPKCKNFRLIALA